MVRTIRARLSKGVFEPLEPEVTTALHEGEEVLLMVSTPASGDLADPIAGTAGAWRGLVDGETLKRHIRARGEGRIVGDLREEVASNDPDDRR